LGLEVQRVEITSMAEMVVLHHGLMAQTLLPAMVAKAVSVLILLNLRQPLLGRMTFILKVSPLVLEQINMEDQQFMVQVELAVELVYQLHAVMDTGQEAQAQGQRLPNPVLMAS
jgi:hypothetical protein